MLDIKFIRDNTKTVKDNLKKRGLKIDIDKIVSLDASRRKILQRLDDLRAKKNKANDEISALLRQKKDPKDTIKSMKKIAADIDKLEKEIKDFDVQLKGLLLNIPNIIHESVPVGSADKKKIIRSWGEPKELDFPARSHIELAEALDIIDFKRASKISGSNFILYKGQGAKLERALFNFMLDLHTKKHGYTEVFPPFLVNRASMTGTGQLPKLEEDMYRLKDDDLFLIPTAEVPVTNIFRDEVLEEDKLPVYYTAYTACFRREAGSYGKDTKGLIRVHQFDKVELVKFTRPENSYDELEKLVNNAEEVLRLLGIPYRVALLTSEDISFAACKCYDLEAWAPGIRQWLEVSSCSNFADFQARRANIRYRRKKDKKLSFVHTLNGSGIALARTVVAILENHQQPDGSILIPGCLRPYLDGREKID
jgi:seryl-tRNA synthetase